MMDTASHTANLFFLGILLFVASGSSRVSDPAQPNFILIFVDDLGYGDLGVQGHPTIRTPRLDQMAAEGMRFTQFYSAASVCTPSRAALLTGRLPVRSGMAGQRRVLFPNSALGLPADELTIAEALKSAGYATAAVGKWHLGHREGFFPTDHGFDSYFGIPYSNDMKPTPLMRDKVVIEEPADQRTLTRRYTEEARRFIASNKDRPFFLYFAHTFPHTPLFASDEFLGLSPRGLYGDVVEELDWSVGQVLDALREAGIEKQTFVFFTSDNGPWLSQGEDGGSAGLLRDGKGTTFEGGMRVPTIARWPGFVPPGITSTELGSTLDVMPTILAIANVPIPTDRVMDGFDLTPVLTGASGSPREVIHFYRNMDLYAVRLGPWKAHFMTRRSYVPDEQWTHHDPPLLFHLDRDPSEQYNLASEHPEVLARIAAEAERHTETLEPRPSQLDTTWSVQ